MQHVVVFGPRAPVNSKATVRFQYLALRLIGSVGLEASHARRISSGGTIQTRALQWQLATERK